MHFLALVLLSGASFACPNLSGTFSDRDLFRESLTQSSCDALHMTSSVHPKNPHPPGPPQDQPSVTEWVIDCQKHPSAFQMVANCWNKDVLESWTYGKNTQGRWIPFSIRRLYLDQNGDLHDDAYLTDASGDERKYLEALYRREVP